MRRALNRYPVSSRKKRNRPTLDRRDRRVRARESRVKGGSKPKKDSQMNVKKGAMRVAVLEQRQSRSAASPKT